MQCLTELLRGKGAHVDPIACVEDVSSELATRRIEGFPHSIADLVFHMNYWMSYELKRICDERPTYPQHNSESFPDAPQNWEQLKRDLSWFLGEFLNLAHSSPEELDRQIESSHPADKQQSSTMEAILWQMVAHNSYHTGQIAMLRRAMSAWPPKSGSDTW
ncbi:MAG TPA: DinB family protein [Candidatus Sulfotelmatobacter sp.]|nr:DinB family protein [Candidatus Sulfotelmatobacter sp.]